MPSNGRWDLIQHVKVKAYGGLSIAKELLFRRKSLPPSTGHK